MSALAELQNGVELALRGGAYADDRELAARIRNEGRRLVFLLGGLVRASRLYLDGNDALIGPSQELAVAVASLVEKLGAVRLVLVEQQAYVNDVRLRLRAAEQQVTDQLCAELARHDLGGLTIHQRLDAAALRGLARALSETASGESPLLALRERLRELGDVEVSGRWRFRAPGEEWLGPRSHADLLAGTEAALRDTRSRLHAGWMPDPLRMRRAVIALVDGQGASPDRAPLAPFAGLPGTGERHLLAVCQLSLMLGRALGLDDATLSDLGVAALVHDLGYLVVRDHGRHALAGARLLLRQRGFGAAKVRRLRAVLEHHQDAGDCRADWPNLFARILHVADDYDLMLVPRAAAPPVSPALALARLWSGRGTRYDPTILAAFTREMGQYPPGTLLRLSDGSAAVAVRANRSRAGWALPLVRIVAPAGGGAVAMPQEIDLSERSSRLSVAGVLEPGDAIPTVLAASKAALAAPAA